MSKTCKFYFDYAVIIIFATLLAITGAHAIKGINNIYGMILENSVTASEPCK